MAARTAATVRELALVVFVSALCADARQRTAEDSLASRWRARTVAPRWFEAITDVLLLVVALPGRCARAVLVSKEDRRCG